MTKEEALEKLRKEFHRTRMTQKIHVNPEVIAVILGYPPRTMRRAKRAGIEVMEIE